MMEEIVKNVAGGLAVLTCIGLAGYLASTDSSYWGWFLFAGILIAGGVWQ